MSTTAQRKLADALVASNAWSVGAADILGVLVVRPMVRPLPEMADYLRRFHGLQSNDTQKDLQELVTYGLLVVKRQERGVEHYGLASDWLTKTANAAQLNVQELERLVRDAVDEIRTTWSFADLGQVAGNPDQYATWLREIRAARSDVLVWIMSGAYPQLLEAIEQASQQNAVPVKVLLGAPSAVSSLRGPAEGKRAEESAQAWSKLTTKTSTVQVRQVTNVADLFGSGSSLIDRTFWRFTVYDSEFEHGSDGVMIELSSSSPRNNLNLIVSYETMFFDAWRRGLPLPMGGGQWAAFKSRALRAFRLGSGIAWVVLGALVIIAVVSLQAGGGPNKQPSGWVVALQELGKAAGVAAASLGTRELVAAWTRRRRITARKKRSQ